jgi:hypothetical protein
MANRSNEINWPKIALAKYLPNAIFGFCEFFPVPKASLTLQQVQISSLFLCMVFYIDLLTNPY